MLTGRKFTGDRGGGLAFFPGNVGGLLASTSHCCHSVSWFNNILRAISFRYTVQRGERKGGRGEKRSRRNILACLPSPSLSLLSKGDVSRRGEGKVGLGMMYS